MIRYTHTHARTYHIAQLCGGGKYWRIGLSPRIGGEKFGKFGFKSKDTKFGKKILVGKILANGSRFAKFSNIFPRHIIVLYGTHAHTHTHKQTQTL